MVIFISFLCCSLIFLKRTHLHLDIFLSILFIELKVGRGTIHAVKKMANQGINQVDEILKDLQRTPGFKDYIILNNDGIVIRHTMESNERAVQHAHHITELYNKSVAQIQDLFDHPDDNRVENVRMRTEKYEMIVSSIGSYTLAVFQQE